jgi:predicted ATPase with chaperone activity
LGCGAATLRVARTSADLESADRIAEGHIPETLGYRLDDVAA